MKLAEQYGRITAPDGCRSRLPSVSTGRKGGREEEEGGGRVEEEVRTFGAVVCKYGKGGREEGGGMRDGREEGWKDKRP
jgi:hypothetical protein